MELNIPPARSEEAAPLCATAAFSRDMTDEERREQRRQRRSLRNDQQDQQEEEVPMTVVDFLEAVEHPLKDKVSPDLMISVCLSSKM